MNGSEKPIIGVTSPAPAPFLAALARELPTAEIRWVEGGNSEPVPSLLLVPVGGDAAHPLIRSLLSRGVPVAAADTPELRSLIGAGGILVERGADAQTWALAIRPLLCDPAALEGLARKAAAQGRRLAARDPQPGDCAGTKRGKSPPVSVARPSTHVHTQTSAQTVQTGRPLPREQFAGFWDEPAFAPAPSFSVVMPCFNMAGRGLGGAIESVQAQTRTDWELLIIDDGSSDGSDRVAEWYAGRDHRIRLHRQPENRGLPAARNAGYWLARGEFVAHLDADDEYLPDKLSQQLARHIANPAAGVSFGPALRNGRPAFNYEETSVPGGWEAVSERCLTPCQSVVLRRSLLQLVGGNDADTPALRGKGQDWDQWVRALAISDAEILPEPLYILHEHRQGITGTLGDSPEGRQADALVLARARRLAAARSATCRRPTRVAVFAADAYSRGAQTLVLSLLRHLPRGEFEIVLALNELVGELLPLYEGLCEVRSFGRDGELLAEWADVIHHHHYAWTDPEAIRRLAGRKLVVTEHSAVERWPRTDPPGSERIVHVWQSRRPPPGTVLPREFLPPALEISVPLELAATAGPCGLLPDFPAGPLVLGLLPGQRQKGLDVWMAAAEHVFRARPDAVFVIAGLRPRLDEILAEFTDQGGWTARVRAAGMRLYRLPPQGRSAVVDLCRRASVLLHLPRTEAVGMVLLEAQACGTPVVVTAVGGTRQVVYCGKVVATEQPAAAAEAVLALLPQRVPDSDRRTIEWRHDPRRIAASYAELYRWIRLQGELRGKRTTQRV